MGNAAKINRKTVGRICMKCVAVCKSMIHLFERKKKSLPLSVYIHIKYYCILQLLYVCGDFSSFPHSMKLSSSLIRFINKPTLRVKITMCVQESHWTCGKLKTIFIFHILHNEVHSPKWPTQKGTRELKKFHYINW